MLIPEKFYEMHEIKSINIKEKFYSKNNNVYWIQAYKEGNVSLDLAVKLYKQSRYSFNKEVDILRHLKEYGVLVPEVFYTSSNLIIMEHISGEVLLDKILNLESEDDKLPEAAYKIIYDLAHWLKSFYFAMTKWKKRLYVKEDVNLRNFIYRDRIYGIDFENCHPGVVEEDIGKLCAFILTYSPEFTPWRCKFTENLIRIFTEEMLLDTEVVIMEMRKEIAVISGRRNATYSQALMNTIVNCWRKSKIVYKVK